MSRLGSFTPEEETVPTVQVGWIGPRASIFLVAVGNIIISKAFHLITLVDWFKNTNKEIKGKVHPRTDHEGLEMAVKYSPTLSLTSALDAGGLSTPRPGRFTSGKDPVTIV